MTRTEFHTLAIGDQVSHPVLRDAVTVYNQYTRIIAGVPTAFVWLGPSGYEVSEYDFIVQGLQFADDADCNDVIGEPVGNVPYRLDDFVPVAEIARERASESMGMYA